MPHIQIFIFILIVFLGGWLVFFLCDKISNSKGISYTALSTEEIEDIYYMQIFFDLQCCSNSLELFFIQDDVIAFKNNIRNSNTRIEALNDLFTQKSLAIGGVICEN